MPEQRGRHGKGHKQDESRKQVRYTVWNNTNDQLIALDESGPECARLMGMKYSSFLSAVSRAGKRTKWTVEKVFTDEMTETEEDE